MIGQVAAFFFGPVDQGSADRGYGKFTVYRIGSILIGGEIR